MLRSSNLIWKKETLLKVKKQHIQEPSSFQQGLQTLAWTSDAAHNDALSSPWPA